MKVAFIGTMMSGKTTAADYLVDTYGFTRLAFADPVKYIAADLLNHMIDVLGTYTGNRDSSYDWTYNQIQKRKGEPQVRKLLQLVGTELGRELLGHENVWVDILVDRANTYDSVVVDDCRFPNELEALRESGFHIVRITRPEKDRIHMVHDRYGDGANNILIHPSETSLNHYEPDSNLYAESIEGVYTGVEMMLDIVD